MQTVNWSVNNTDVAPINCTLVDVFTSTDGGMAFLPAPVASALPNTGTASITMPTGAQFYKNTLRLKIATSNVLTWSTAEESKNAGFDVEMSTDAKTCLKVGFVDGKGDIKATTNYDYTVSSLVGGTYYFRLKQMDFDGKFEYSRVRSIEIVSPDDLVSVYPNPSNGKLKFNTGIHRTEAFGIRIFSQSGQLLLSKPVGSTYANGQELDVTNLPAGLYNVILQGASFSENLKFVKY